MLLNNIHLYIKGCPVDARGVTRTLSASYDKHDWRIRIDSVFLSAFLSIRWTVIWLDKMTFYCFTISTTTTIPILVDSPLAKMEVPLSWICQGSCSQEFVYVSTIFFENKGSTAARTFWQAQGFLGWRSVLEKGWNLSVLQPRFHVETVRKVYNASIYILLSQKLFVNYQ